MDLWVVTCEGWVSERRFQFQICYFICPMTKMSLAKTDWYGLGWLSELDSSWSRVINGLGLGINLLKPRVR